MTQSFPCSLFFSLCFWCNLQQSYPCHFEFYNTHHLSREDAVFVCVNAKRMPFCVCEGQPSQVLVSSHPHCIAWVHTHTHTHTVWPAVIEMSRVSSWIDPEECNITAASNSTFPLWISTSLLPISTSARFHCCLLLFVAFEAQFVSVQV